MSGSKLLRLCSLFLCLLLCLANFSVVANAAESDFSDISDLTNWEVDPENSYPIEILYKYNTTYGHFYRYSVKSGFKVGDYAAVYNIPELSTGSTYKFNFTLLHPSAGLPFFDNGTLSVGFAIKNGDGSITLCEESYITFTDPFVDLPDRFNDFEISFTYNGVGTPCIVILSVMHTDNPTNTDLALHFQNISFTQSATETEKKLDGVLGWLEELVTWVKELPGLVASKFSSFFASVEQNLDLNFDTLWETLAERLNVFDNFLTEIRNFFHDLYWDLVGGTCVYGDYHSSLFERLGDRISGFFDDLKLKIDVKVEEIKTSIHDFFVPPEGFFEEWKDKFDLMLSDNLGFIYQAPNFVISIIEVVQEILQTDQEVNLVFPEVEFDIAGYHIELFKDTKVDFSFLEAGIWLTLYTMYKVMLYVIFALALIKYGIDTWERTMSN